MSIQSKRSLKNYRRTLLELVLFAMFGALMFCSKLLMEAFPNIHLLGMFTMMLTVVFRVKALIPIYIYVLLNGVFAGFDLWWFPYLYIWTILWGITMLIPKNISPKAACIVYPAICALHGFAYGALYAPAQAVMFGFNFNQTLAWIATGIPFDIIHGVSNIFTGLLIYPFSELVKKLLKERR